MGLFFRKKNQFENSTQREDFHDFNQGKFNLFIGKRKYYLHYQSINLFFLQMISLILLPGVRSVLIVKLLCGIPLAVLQSMFSGYYYSLSIYLQYSNVSIYRGVSSEGAYGVYVPDDLLDGGLSPPSIYAPDEKSSNYALAIIIRFFICST